MTFEVTRDRIRHPDVAVLTSKPKRVRGERHQGAPALAIEIVSANDAMTDVEDKIELYLAHGAAAVWIVFPVQRKIRIHRPNHAVRELVPGDTLRGEPPIPMFELDVAGLFAA